MNATNNILEQLLSADTIQQSKKLERYERGMFISINNHKQGSDDLCGLLKKQYQSLLYALTGKNIGRDEIKVTGKLPNQKTILHLMAKKRVVVAAALHSYDAYNQRTGRGSKCNYGGYNHLHFYVYGLHYLLQQHKGGVDEGVEHIKKCLYRHSRFASATNEKNIDVKEVGIGKYQYNDVVSPSSLYEYLSTPKTNPSRQCVINYMAGNLDNGGINPIVYIYQTGV